VPGQHSPTIFTKPSDPRVPDTCQIALLANNAQHRLASRAVRQQLIEATLKPAAETL